MNSRRQTVTLPSIGNHDYYELPHELQQLIVAVNALDEASAALDGAERATRDLSGDPQRQDVWRWYQDASLATYKLYERTKARAEVSYIGWLMDCEAEEGARARGEAAAQTLASLRNLAQDC